MTTIDHQQAAILAATKKGAKNDAQAVRNYREATAAVDAAAPHLRAAWEQENEQKLATIREWAERWAKHPDNPGAWAAGVAILALLEGGAE